MGDGVQLSGRVLLSTRKALGSIPSTFGGGGRGAEPHLSLTGLKSRSMHAVPLPEALKGAVFLLFQLLGADRLS